MINSADDLDNARQMARACCTKSTSLRLQFDILGDEGQKELIESIAQGLLTAYDEGLQEGNLLGRGEL